MPTEDNQQIMMPQGGGQMNFDQNPFEAILAQGGGQMPSQQPQQPMAPEEMENMPEELQPGKTGDNTKPLLGAIQNLHNYIGMTTDPGDIRLVRNLISALTQLVARDQKRMEQMAAEQGAQQPAPQPAAAPLPVQ